MAEDREKNSQSQIRSTALKHALSIEEKKRLKARVTDLVLEAYDLPSSANADPAHPLAADAALFHQCLKLFQPSDLDDLVRERNIDDRCGYALCPNPNKRVSGGSDKVWNQKSGRDFKIVDKRELEKWCSKACGKRTAFIHAQLSSEPAWIRESEAEVRLLDELGNVDDLSNAVKALSVADMEDNVAQKLRTLSLERGQDGAQNTNDQISIIERVESGIKSAPPKRGDQSVEGYQPRKVRFE